MDASSCRTAESSAFLSSRHLSRRGFWQAFRVHSSTDSEALMDSKFHLQKVRDGKVLVTQMPFHLPLKYSIQLWIVSGGSVSFMCFRASSSSTSPVGVSDFKMIFLHKFHNLNSVSGENFVGNLPGTQATSSHACFFQFNAPSQSQLNQDTPAESAWYAVIPKWCVALKVASF